MKGFGQRMNCTSSRQASALSCAWSRWMKSSMRRDSNTTMRVQNFGAFFSSGPLSGNVLFSWRTAGYPSLYACLSPHVFCPEPIAHLLASPRSKASKLPSHGGYTLGIDAASSQCMQGCIPTLWHRFAWECLEKTLDIAWSAWFCVSARPQVFPFRKRPKGQRGALHLMYEQHPISKR